MLSQPWRMVIPWISFKIQPDIAHSRRSLQINFEGNRIKSDKDVVVLRF